MSYDPNEPRDAHGRWGSGGQNLLNLKTALHSTSTNRQISDFSRRSLTAPLTSEEAKAIDGYSSSHFYDINTFLRSGYIPNELDYEKGFIQKSIDTLDNAFKKASIADDLVVHRFIDKEVRHDLNNVGSVVKDPAFLSTTLSKVMPRGLSEFVYDANRFKIFVPKGYPGFPLAEHANEEYRHDKEVLLKRDTHLKVLGKNVLEVIK